MWWRTRSNQISSFWWNGRVRLNRRWASVLLTTGSQGAVISHSNAGYTMFRGSVKGTGHPLHLPVSPSLPLPCITMCHHISTGVYRIPPYTYLYTVGRCCYTLDMCLRSFFVAPPASQFSKGWQNIRIEWFNFACSYCRTDINFVVMQRSSMDCLGMLRTWISVVLTVQLSCLLWTIPLSRKA